jgi:hypothetical protein
LPASSPMKYYPWYTQGLRRMSRLSR